MTLVTANACLCDEIYLTNCFSDRVMLQGMPAYAAVAEPRVHDQLTNVTYVEDWNAGNTSFRMPVDVRTVRGGCKRNSEISHVGAHRSWRLWDILWRPSHLGQ